MSHQTTVVLLWPYHDILWFLKTLLNSTIVLFNQATNSKTKNVYSDYQRSTTTKDSVWPQCLPEGKAVWKQTYDRRWPWWAMLGQTTPTTSTLTTTTTTTTTTSTSTLTTPTSISPPPLLSFPPHHQERRKFDQDLPTDTIKMGLPSFFCKFWNSRASINHQSFINHPNKKIQIWQNLAWDSKILFCNFCSEFSKYRTVIFDFVMLTIFGNSLNVKNCLRFFPMKQG